MLYVLIIWQLQIDMFVNALYFWTLICPMWSNCGPVLRRHEKIRCSLRNYSYEIEIWQELYCLIGFWLPPPLWQCLIWQRCHYWCALARLAGLYSRLYIFELNARAAGVVHTWNNWKDASACWLWHLRCALMPTTWYGIWTVLCILQMITLRILWWFDLKCASTKHWYLDAAIWFACKMLNLTFKCDQEWKQHVCCMYRTRSYDNLLCFAKLLKDWWGNDVTLACMHHGFRLDSLIFCIWDAALNCNSTCESKDHALYYIMTLSRARHG